jgi:hypothetical protein
VQALLWAQLLRRPVTIVRHDLVAVRRMVERLLETHTYDVVHVEQQQALAAAEPARRAGIPVVMRAQNVESLLWIFAAKYRPPVVRWAFRREARRLARWEGRCARRTTATVALTPVDAGHLSRLSGGKARIEVVEAPFQAELEPGPEESDGDPVVALLASGKWVPNRDAVWRFAGETWPAVVARLPQARLHVYGIDRPPELGTAVTWHAPPDHSASAFPEKGIFVVPARHPTGVPMKCLEAWARGLPVVGSPEAADQLAATDGVEMMVAGDPLGFAEATASLAEAPELRSAVVDGGRAALRLRHAPDRCASRLQEIYRQAMGL